MNQGADYGKAEVSHKEDWQPISVNKNSVKRQYYRKIKEPELISLQNTEKTFPNNKKGLRCTLPQYKDTEDTDPDNLLHCPECGAKWGGNCPLHGFLHVVNDVAVPRHTSNTLRADLTTPYVVNVRTLLTGEIVVSARMPIPIRTRFGPYGGQVVSPEEASEHAWLIRKNGKPDHCIDALEPGHSNWMRYVRNAPVKGVENLLAYQYHGKLYYMTIRNLFPEEELLVWCGSRYKQPLGEGQDNLSKPEVAKNIKKEIVDDTGAVREVSRYIKKEVEDVSDDAMQDRQSRTEDGVISEDSRLCNEDVVLNRNVVKTEVVDDSYFEDNPGEVKGGRDLEALSGDDKVDEVEDVVEDVEEMRKKIKLEVIEDSRDDILFIKEEVEAENANQDLTDEVNENVAEVRDDQNKQSSDQDVMALDFANSTDINSENGIGGFAENASTNGYEASFSIPHTVTEEAAIRMEGPCERNTESIVDLCSDEVSTEIHLEAQPKKNTLSCSGCKKSFPCKAKLNRHLQIRHGGKPFECCECKMKFACKSGLTKHLCSHVEDNKSGRRERNPLLSPNKNKRNNTKHGSAPLFTCFYRDCSLRFVSRFKYRNHVLKHKIQMAVKCPKCLKELGLQVNLNAHLQRTLCSYLPYVCSKCRTAFKEDTKLKDHTCLAETQDNGNVAPSVNSKNQETTRRYLCSECNLHYDSRRELNGHFRLSHSPQNSIFCNYCKKMYSSHYVLKKHVRRVHSKERPHVRSKQYFADVDLQRHLSIHSENKNYNCAICVKDFSSKDEFSKHLSTHKNELSCRLCDRQYGSYLILQQHVRHKHPGAKLFECFECKEKFRFHSELEKHMEFHAREKLLLNEASDLPLAETESHETLTLFDDLDSEWTVKTKVCSNCKRVFSTDKALFNHVCTMLTREVAFESNNCSKESNIGLDRERHLRDPQNERRPYLCVECNSDFSCQSLLDDHQCFDHNERPIACLECDRRFWSDAAYKRHLRSHVVDKPHVCSECAESFALPEQLEAHLQTHSKDSPFTCAECDPGLYEKYRLNRQFRTECDEDTNVTCVQCDRTFPYASLTEQVTQDHRPFEFVSCEPE